MVKVLLQTIKVSLNIFHIHNHFCFLRVWRFYCYFSNGLQTQELTCKGSLIVFLCKKAIIARTLNNSFSLSKNSKFVKVKIKFFEIKNEVSLPSKFKTQISQNDPTSWLYHILYKRFNVKGHLIQQWKFSKKCLKQLGT